MWSGRRTRMFRSSFAPSPERDNHSPGWTGRHEGDQGGDQGTLYTSPTRKLPYRKNSFPADGIVSKRPVLAPNMLTIAHENALNARSCILRSYNRPERLQVVESVNLF